MMHTIALRAGTLRLHVQRAELALEELCGFASRRSRKRGFVFVSKVLGKHYPVRPATMAMIHDRLAAKLDGLIGPVMLIALAETAIGLGHGIAEAWQRRSGRDDLLFQHTTRYRLRRPLALDFEEAHSHATEHLLYRPIEREHDALFRSARTLVLVDDEMSTGRTLANLATAYIRVNPDVEVVHLMCITDWLGPSRRRGIAQQIGVPTQFHSLLAGSYEFTDDPSFDPGPVASAVGRGDFKDYCLPGNHGRLGLGASMAPDLDRMSAAANIGAGERVLVLGTGEFAHPPFLLARALESDGHNVHYQSTTRSPLLIDRDITSVLEFGDNYQDGIANYLYNVADRAYDRILVGCETPACPRIGMGGATEFFFWRDAASAINITKM